MKNKNIYLAIFAVAIIVCILSPFLASGDPDGLEKSAEELNPEILEGDQVMDVAMPDYTLPEFEENPLVGVACLIVGTIIAVVIAYGVFRLINKH